MSLSGAARLSSGIGGLDDVLRGGFLKGGLYIIQGPPGAGKTTFGNQICFHHTRDLPGAVGSALYVTLLAESHARMLQNVSGLSFFDLSRIPDRLAYLNGLLVLRQEGLRGLLDLLRREIVARGTTMLVLDGIVSVVHLAKTEHDYNEFLHELQSVALATDCTMFMLTSGAGSRISAEYTMVDGIVELDVQLFGWASESILQVTKLRGSDYLHGRHAYQISDDGLTIYPRIESLFARPSREDPGVGARTTCGNDGLDRLLGGGLPEASTTVVLGPSGIGKTTLGLQFLAASVAKAPGLLFGFYETPARITAKCRQVCPSLGPLLASGGVRMVWHPPTDGLLDAYGAQILSLVRTHGTRRLFIDGLGALQAASSDPRRMGHFLTALMNELRVLGVTTLFTLEVADIIGPNMRAPIGDLSNLAENLVLLRYVELRSSLHRLMSVLKVRDSDFDPSLTEFTTSAQGLMLQADPLSAERIMRRVSSATGGAPEAEAAPRLDP